MARYHQHGQHFLRSPRVAAELVGHSNIRKNDLVYDLGAGSGVITGVLARRCRQVVAVEIEPQAVRKLRGNTAGQDNVTIIEGDILTCPLPQEPYKIFANIPFHLSAPIVRRFTEAERPPKVVYLIVQRQFARKLVPGRDHFTSQLGAELGPLFAARIRKPLKKSDFTPPPAVETVLLELKQRDEPLVPRHELPEYRSFVAQCFTNQKFYATTNRAAAGLSPERSPSQLDVEEWVALWQHSPGRTRSIGKKAAP